MKTNLTCLFGVVLILGIPLRGFSQGYIVSSGIRYSAVSGVAIIYVDQNPTNGNYTGFSLDPQGGNNFLFDPFVDEGVRTFLVAFNDPVSLSAIQSGSYAELLYPSTYNLTEGSPFYVGLYTGDQFPQNGIYPNPMFGWAQLVNNDGVIELLDSALAYGSAGIYAGTQTLIPIPEPGTLNLAGLALIALAWGRNGRRRTGVSDA